MILATESEALARESTRIIRIPEKSDFNNHAATFASIRVYSRLFAPVTL